eukprot:5185679-Pyramimonas_sp.AAC.1
MPGLPLVFVPWPPAGGAPRGEVQRAPSSSAPWRFSSLAVLSGSCASPRVPGVPGWCPGL